MSSSKLTDLPPISAIALTDPFYVVDVSLGAAGSSQIEYTSLFAEIIRDVTIHVTDAVTNTLSTVFTLKHSSTGSVADAFGGRLDLRLESATNSDRRAGAIDWYWTTATDATRASAILIKVVSSGTEKTVVVFSSTSPNVFIESQAATHIPLTIRGAASQSVNLLTIQNSSPSTLVGVSYLGNVTANPTSAGDYTNVISNTAIYGYGAQGTGVGSAGVAGFAPNGGSSGYNVRYAVFGGYPQGSTGNWGVFAACQNNYSTYAFQDVGNFTAACAALGIASQGDPLMIGYQGTTEILRFSYEGLFIFPYTYTAAGTTGARTINKPSGSVNFAAAATSLVVTNSLVTTNSIIFCIVATNDTTMKAAAAVPASGSFTIYPDAAPTAETRVAWWVLNA